MVRREFILALSLGAFALAGCASAGAGGSRPSTNRITREELQRLEPLSAYEAIERLRPRWLQSRGMSSLRGGPTLPRVHLDQSPLESLDALRSLSVSEVEYMEFRSAADATTRYGTGYPGGVIEIRTRS